MFYSMEDLQKIYLDHHIVEEQKTSDAGEETRITYRDSLKEDPNHEALVHMLERMPLDSRGKVIASLARSLDQCDCEARDFCWWDIMPSQNILFFTLILPDHREIPIAIYWKSVRKGQRPVSEFVNPQSTWERDVSLPGGWRYAIETTYWRNAINMIVSAIQKEQRDGSVFQMPPCEVPPPALALVGMS